MIDVIFPPPDFHQVDSVLPGIEVFAPKPAQTSPQPDVLDFKCPQCGANTAFSAADGGLTCSYCGYYEAPARPAIGRRAAEFEFTTETMKRAAQGWGEQRRELACQSCGAQVSTPADSLTHTCPFCGSHKVIQRQAEQNMLRPSVVIPFKIEAQHCQKIVHEWLGSSWLTPASLRQAAKSAGVNGIYLPFWTFDSLIQANWKAEVGHSETERYFENGEWKTRTVIRWRWEAGRAQVRIDDLVVCGTDRLSSRLLKEIGQYDLSALADYEPKYLAGLNAKAYDIPLEKAWELGRAEMRERTRQACLAQASTSQVRNFSMDLDFGEESWRYLLAPVYLASYRYEQQIYQVMLNGQTGAISGQRPADWNKVWLVIALLLVPGMLLGLVGLITIPLGGAGLGIGGFGFILLVIGAVLSVILYQKAGALDDA